MLKPILSAFPTTSRSPYAKIFPGENTIIEIWPGGTKRGNITSKMILETIQGSRRELDFERLGDVGWRCQVIRKLGTQHEVQGTAIS